VKHYVFLDSASEATVNHSRWLTVAARVLVLYSCTRTVEPPSALVSLATFVQQVYGPMWFQIKSRPSFTSGAVHLFSSMQLIKTQPDDVQKVTKEVVETAEKCLLRAL